MHAYSSIDTTAAWKKLRLNLLIRSDCYMSDSLPIAVHVFSSHVSMSFLIDEMLLPRLVNLSSSLNIPLFSVEMSPL